MEDEGYVYVTQSIGNDGEWKVDDRFPKLVLGKFLKLCYLCLYRTGTPILLQRSQNDPGTPICKSCAKHQLDFKDIPEYES